MIAELASGLALAAAAGVGWAYKKVGGTTGDQRLHRLAPDTYVYRGFFSNSAALVLPDGVVVVDTQTTPEVGARLRRQIAAVSPQPVRRVINTHYHGDHVGGNAAFADAEIIAPLETATYIGERDQERVEYCHTFGLLLQDVPHVRPPDRTFQGRLELDCGGERLEVLQLGKVETPDAAVVWWPSRGVLVAGDGVATDQYPWLGVPFLDEGLQDDGEWLRHLAALRALRPRVLIPGHGQPLVGEKRIHDRLLLLEQLLTALLETAREEHARGTPVEALVERVDGKLAHFRARKDLIERVVSQRYAIWRAYNSVNPDRRGRGWWHDFRPSAIRRAPPAELEAALASSEPIPSRAAALLRQGALPLSLSLLEHHLERHPEDGAAAALLSEVLVRSALTTKPIVDAMEYVKHATHAARRALQHEPSSATGLLNLGVVEAWSGLVTGQNLEAAMVRLEAAYATGTLDAMQRQRACFFLARSMQALDRDAEAAAWYRRLLPWPLRPLAPLLVPRMRTLP